MRAISVGQPQRSLRLSLPLLVMGAMLLAAAGGASAQSGKGPFIRLRYATFDPLQGVPDVDPALRTVPASMDEVGRYLVQFEGPVKPQWVAAVRSRGIVIEDYVPDYAFVVRATLRQVSALPNAFPFVRWTGVFHAAYKIEPRALAPTVQPLTARTASRPEAMGLAMRLQRFGAGVMGQTATTVEVAGSRQLAMQLARTPEVKWVQVRRTPHVFNDRAANIIGVSGSLGVRVRGFYGKGQIVAVADSGLDTGDPQTLNRDFQGRVLATFALGRPTTNDWSDPTTGLGWGGHGTHVAGSVLGSGANSGANPAQHNYGSSHAGMAPEASLVFQSIEDDRGGLGGVPLTLYDLFIEPYKLGARVHTNSWGASDIGTYTDLAASVDQFVYDNPDMTILFAAGNDGIDRNGDGVVDPGSIGDPAAAKNIITVGASENLRPPTENWGGNTKQTWSIYGDLFPPLSTDFTADKPNGMAAFSSRGPAADGRIKPDIVAPGTGIVSVLSRLSAAGGEVLDGEFAGAYSDANTLSKYAYSSGTSMATPVAAGAAALVREFYTKKQWNPSAALVKATLINGAYDMNPGQYGLGPAREMSQRPNGVEGFGRVDLVKALTPTPPRSNVWVDNPTGLSTGQNIRFQYHVQGTADPLTITLVWTDPPGAPFALPALVNNLDLSVTDPSGTTFYGNGAAAPGDTLNNVENIDIARPQAGIYTIQIAGTNIPMGPQTFALVVSGNGAPASGRFPDITPPLVKITSPQDGAIAHGWVNFQVQAMDDQGIDRVMLQIDGVRIGSRYAAPYNFNWNTAGWRPGTHTVTATAIDTSKNTTVDTISINVQ